MVTVRLSSSSISSMTMAGLSSLHIYVVAVAALPLVPSVHLGRGCFDIKYFRLDGNELSGGLRADAALVLNAAWYMSGV